MKNLSLYFLITFIIACSPPIKTEDETIVKIEVDSKPEMDSVITNTAEPKTQETYTLPKRLDIANNILKELFTENIYIIVYKNKTLSASGFDRLYYLDGLGNPYQIEQKFPHLKDSTYTDNEYNGKKQYKVYYDLNSKIKWSSWTDPNDHKTYEGITRDSYIQDTAITFNFKINIGMSKDRFFKEYFTNVPDTIYSGTERVSISETDLGVNFKNYYFRNDTLVKIDFKEYL